MNKNKRFFIKFSFPVRLILGISIILLSISCFWIKMTTYFFWYELIFNILFWTSIVLIIYHKAYCSLDCFSGQEGD
ncbi:MAG: hypothetical protein C0180_06670 [Aciduliprofundum sp.]|nr:MAG: hypothetical protein C0180_06670 [Aciduliprofundum sp.]